MSEYKYDYLLADQFEKTAIWNMLAAGATKLAPVVARAGASLAQRASPTLARAGTALVERAAPAITRAGQSFAQRAAPAAGEAAQGIGGRVMQYGRNLGGAMKTEGFGGTAKNLAKGMFGFAPAEGASAGAHMIHGAGQTAGMAQGAYGLGSAVFGGGGDSGGQNKTNSLREKQAQYFFKGASHSPLQKALHLSPYAAWMGSQLLEDKYPRLAKGLNLGAYALYAGMAGHEALTNPNERLTSGTDALALTAMGIADLARMRRNSQNSTAEGH